MTAYAISQTVTRVVAFFGMYVLLKKHIIPTKSGFHPNWRIACICLNTVLAFGNAEYAWHFGTVGFFKYPKRGYLMERVADAGLAPSILKLCSRLLLFPDRDGVFLAV